jgi:hypothetical protein
LKRSTCRDVIEVGLTAAAVVAIYLFLMSGGPAWFAADVAARNVQFAAVAASVGYSLFFAAMFSILGLLFRDVIVNNL